MASWITAQLKAAEGLLEAVDKTVSRTVGTLGLAEGEADQPTPEYGASRLATNLHQASPGAGTYSQTYSSPSSGSLSYPSSTSNPIALPSSSGLGAPGSYYNSTAAAPPWQPRSTAAAAFTSSGHSSGRALTASGQDAAGFFTVKTDAPIPFGGAPAAPTSPLPSAPEGSSSSFSRGASALLPSGGGAADPTFISKPPPPAGLPVSTAAAAAALAGPPAAPTPQASGVNATASSLHTPEAFAGSNRVAAPGGGPPAGSLGAASGQTAPPPPPSSARGAAAAAPAGTVAPPPPTPPPPGSIMVSPPHTGETRAEMPASIPLGRQEALGSVPQSRSHAGAATPQAGAGAAAASAGTSPDPAPIPIPTPPGPSGAAPTSPATGPTPPGKGGAAAAAVGATAVDPVPGAPTQPSASTSPAPVAAASSALASATTAAASSLASATSSAVTHSISFFNLVLDDPDAAAAAADGGTGGGGVAQQVQSLSRTCDQLRKRLEASRAENEQLEDMLARAEVRAQQEGALVAALREELGGVQLARASVESSLAAQLAVARSSLGEVCDKFEISQRSVLVLEGQLAALEESSRRLMEQHSDREGGMVDALRSELAATEARLAAESKAHQASRSAAAVREQDLEQQVAGSTAALGDLTRGLEEANRKCRGLEEDLVVATRGRNELAAQVAALQRQLEDAGLEVELPGGEQGPRLGGPAAHRGAAAAAAAAELEVLRAELVQAQRAALAGRQAADASTAQAAALAQEVEALRQSAEQHKDTAQLEEQLREVSEMLYLKQTQMERLAAEKAAQQLKTERELEGLRQELAKLTRQTIGQGGGIRGSDGVSSSSHDVIPMDALGEPYQRLVRHNNRVGRAVKAAANFLDSTASTTSFVLRQYPLARLVVFAYALLIHLYVYLLIARMQRLATHLEAAVVAPIVA